MSTNARSLNPRLNLSTDHLSKTQHARGQAAPALLPLLESAATEQHNVQGRGRSGGGRHEGPKSGGGGRRQL